MAMLLILSFLHTLARAEYRAFELVITNPTTGGEKVVISTLDPNQYRQWYPVQSDEVITYRSTWMCKGNTSGLKPTCPPPQQN